MVEFTDDFAEKIKSFSEQTVFVVDKNVYSIYKDGMSIDNSRLFLMDAVESKKNMDTVMEIIQFLKNCGVQKNWKIACFGGGITQDVTTVAANLYLRNIDWIFFPTTLLSMSDSCIGGKCGINFGPYKNQIGVFYPPKKVIIDTAFIETLTEADYLNGWGEILKFSLTLDKSFFEKVEKEEIYIPCQKIDEYIYEGLITKKTIIEEDEFDTDLRRVLNYGHSFGHALEAYTDNEIPHGKAVIWGIDVANYIAVEEGLISREYYIRVKELICKRFLTKEIEIDNPEKIIEILRTDKKVKNNVLSFALLNGESHLIVHQVELNDRLYQMFVDYLGETHDYYCH